MSNTPMSDERMAEIERWAEEDALELVAEIRRLRAPAPDVTEVDHPWNEHDSREYERIRQRLTQALNHDGHNEPCYYCGKLCNDLAANPSEWGVALCHPDDPGVVKWHHSGCVSDRLTQAPPDPFARLEAWLREAARGEVTAKWSDGAYTVVLDWTTEPIHRKYTVGTGTTLAEAVTAALDKAEGK